MPLYTVEYKKPIDPEEVKSYIASCQDPRDLFILGIVYLTGARPIELCGDLAKGYRGLRRKDIYPNPADPHNSIIIHLETAKLKEGGSFNVEERSLEIERSALFANHITDYIETIQDPEAKLLPFCVRRLHAILWRITAEKADAYRFRHSRMLQLSRGTGAGDGASESELMYWKGSKDLRSVSPYVAGVPIGRKLKIR